VQFGGASLIERSLGRALFELDVTLGYDREQVSIFVGAMRFLVKVFRDVVRVTYDAQRCCLLIARRQMQIHDTFAWGALVLRDYFRDAALLGEDHLGESIRLTSDVLGEGRVTAHH